MGASFLKCRKFQPHKLLKQSLRLADPACLNPTSPDTIFCPVTSQSIALAFDDALGI